MNTRTLDLDVSPAVCEHYHTKESDAPSRTYWKRVHHLVRYYRRYFSHNKYAIFLTSWVDGKPTEAWQVA